MNTQPVKINPCDLPESLKDWFARYQARLELCKVEKTESILTLHGGDYVLTVRDRRQWGFNWIPALQTVPPMFAVYSLYSEGDDDGTGERFVIFFEQQEVTP
jgi:hypothetical protein